MGTEYQIFNWKEYVSLRRFWNMEWKYKTEKAKNEQLEEENKKLKSDLAYERTMLDNVRAEYKSQVNINKKLKSELYKYKKQYEHSMDIWEITSIQDWPITWKKDTMWRWYSEWEPPIVLC